MLSQTVEYALRAMVYLASHEATLRTTDQIAEATQVPKAYLSKVLQGLVRSGLVQSQRGIGGGVTTNRSPDKITVLDVVNAVEPIQRIHECPLKLATHGKHLCPLHQRLDDAMALVESAFGKSTLGEILREPGKSVPLCEANAG